MCAHAVCNAEPSEGWVSTCALLPGSAAASEACAGCQASPGCPAPGRLATLAMTCRARCRLAIAASASRSACASTACRSGASCWAAAAAMMPVRQLEAGGGLRSGWRLRHHAGPLLLLVHCKGLLRRSRLLLLLQSLLLLLQQACVWLRAWCSAGGLPGRTWLLGRRLLQRLGLRLRWGPLCLRPALVHAPAWHGTWHKQR